MITFPYSAPAILVQQPMGPFYVTVLPAELLLETCFSDKLRATKANSSGYELSGTQRVIDVERLNAIGSYISRADAAFPNSLILAANYRPEDGFVEEDGELRWSIVEANGQLSILIPSAKQLAAIIDGQHRLFGFTKSSDARLGMSLVCAVYFDLPKPFQAQLFATINSTQKRVDKSLTYELFGYNISEEEAPYWSPDKLAVFIARKLNLQPDSPFANRITISPENDLPGSTVVDGSWHVSMAATVDGLIKLISSNPTKDSNALYDVSRRERPSLRPGRRDASPLRELYLDTNDELLFTIVRNYFHACEELFWHDAPRNSFITRTVGVQALFDILRLLAPRILTAKDARVQYMKIQLQNAADLDFTLDRYNASGSGRTEVKRAIANAIGLT
jgi:DNA phosphorothioation-associated DGQHR protein 1